jgi:hypothetical protein
MYFPSKFDYLVQIFTFDYCGPCLPSVARTMKALAMCMALEGLIALATFDTIRQELWL